MVVFFILKFFCEVESFFIENNFHQFVSKYLPKISDKYNGMFLKRYLADGFTKKRLSSKQLTYVQIWEISLLLFIVYLDNGHLDNYIYTYNIISVIISFIFIYKRLGDLHQLLSLKNEIWDFSFEKLVSPRYSHGYILLS